MSKTPGQLAHEEDVRNIPWTFIAEGEPLVPRKTWDELGPEQRAAWERAPFPRKPEG